ncbi:hypothetical protein BH23PAT2_BH23PAT2_08280 [soil metagenome]
MNEIFSIGLTVLLAFMVADYALGRALVRDPIRAVIAGVFAVLLVILAGVFALGSVV